jgi:hypothetical protein
MFDHESIKGTAMQTMGIFDYFRIPKRSWHWYRSEYAGQAAPTWPTSGTPAALELTASNTTLTADGTEDTHLMVQVVDGSGNAVNGTPTVTLTIASGPGEFPTGPSITFSAPSDDPQSDIVIRDGQAVIAFRSCYAGTTVIEATSSGLTSASVTLTTEGSPAWVSKLRQSRTQSKASRRLAASRSPSETLGRELSACRFRPLPAAPAWCATDSPSTPPSASEQHGRQGQQPPRGDAAARPHPTGATAVLVS